MSEITGLFKFWIWYTLFFIVLGTVLGLIAYPDFKQSTYQSTILGEDISFTYVTSLPSVGIFVSVVGFLFLVWIILTTVMIYKMGLPT